MTTTNYLRIQSLSGSPSRVDQEHIAFFDGKSRASIRLAESDCDLFEDAAHTAGMRTIRSVCYPCAELTEKHDVIVPGGGR